MKKIISFIFFILLLAGGFLAWKLIGPAAHKPEKGFFYLPTGSGMSELKKELRDQKVLSSNFWFSKVASAIHFENVHPGKYKINDGMSILSLVRMLRNGQQTPVNFVVTKIRTNEVLAAKLGNAFESDSAQFMHYLSSGDSLKKFDMAPATVMAMVMPYTYTLKWNSEPGKILQQFETAWKKFWTGERKEKAQKLGLTPVEVSTLASIIDEETNAAADRPNIASVYLNRLKKGMPLQADPTVKFALNDFSIRRVLSGHLQTVSPYNTYKNKGLPPGPICTPQLETIDAVLNAPQTDFIYFVASSKFDGTHLFTTNYEDHMKLARQYQEELNKRNVK